MIRAPTLVFGGGAALLAAAALAQPAEIELPFGETPAELSDPASALVVGKCSACHSLDYITTQPRGKGAQFWRDSVAKMVTVYKAPISPEEADALAATLSSKFG